MLKLIKNSIFVLFLLFGLNFNVSAKEQTYDNVNVQALSASSSTSSFNQLTPRSNISIDKTWTIKFNSNVSMDKIESIVIKKDLQLIPVTINIISNDSITVKPVTPFEKASKYSLELSLSNGKKRSMDFTTEDTNVAFTVNSVSASTIVPGACDVIVTIDTTKYTITADEEIGDTTYGNGKAVLTINRTNLTADSVKTLLHAADKTTTNSNISYTVDSVATSTIIPGAYDVIVTIDTTKYAITADEEVGITTYGNGKAILTINKTNLTTDSVKALLHASQK